MIRVHLLAAAAAVVITSASVAAQSRPDFSGTWVFDASRSSTSGGGRDGARGGGGGRGGGIGLGPPAEQLTVVQNAATIEMQLRIGAATKTVTYALDGSRRSNMVPIGRGGEAAATYESRWDAGKLVTTITRTLSSPGGSTVIRYREVLSLDKDGLLGIETTATGPRSGGRKAVYQKRS
ncbi:MAG TPA: hypothetical protein VES67_10025 [Vicinamibacterales bacterium]|nr:hypothetical protein [Vicinamibacterales bacterium]